MRCFIRSLAIVGLFFSAGASRPVQAQLSDVDVAVSSVGFSATSNLILSRNGNSVFGVSATGAPTVIRNAFQFDQELVTLPAEFVESTVLSVSYYGSVYAWRKVEAGCELLQFSPQNTVRSLFVFNDPDGCTVLSGSSNVVERFVYSVKAGAVSKLMLTFGTSTEELWSNSASTSDVLESFALNDLNTVVYTISKDGAGGREFKTFYWVPGHGSRDLVIPPSAGSGVIARDVNNKNKYLLAAGSDSLVLDPSRRRFKRIKVVANRLTSDGTPYSTTTLAPSGVATIPASCFAKKKLRGSKLQYGAVNDEREILLVTQRSGAAGLAKIIPFSVKGYPSCAKRK